MKLIFKALNGIIAVMCGAVMGLMLSGIVVLVLIGNDIFVSVNNQAINAIMLGPAMILALLALIFEMSEITNRGVNYFRGSLIRKTGLLMAMGLVTISGISLTKKIDAGKYGKYQPLADEIVQKISQNENNEAVVEIANLFHVDYVLVSEGYALTEKSLMGIGKVNAQLARVVARASAENEGTYVYLVKDGRVVARARFGSNIEVRNRFLLAPEAAVIRFHVEKDMKQGAGKAGTILIKDLE